VKLELQPGNQALKVSGQRSQATIRGMDPSEFPTLPSGDSGEQAITLDAAELREMIGEVAFAAATDDARPVFTGVLARVRDERLTLASADSFRLAVATTELPGAPNMADVLIPARALTELARILPAEGEARMVVTPNRNQVLFRAGDVEMLSNLIAGQFPNFEQIVPKSHSTRVTLPTDQFRQAAKTATLFARDSANIVRLKVEGGEPGGLTPGVVTIQATAEEVGDTTNTIEEAAVDGAGMEVIFNVKYVTDVLAVLDTPQVALELNSPQAPGVIRPVGAQGEKYTYVIMPMYNTR
jgi:DNA polymerase-3 subunit beta